MRRTLKAAPPLAQLAVFILIGMVSTGILFGGFLMLMVALGMDAAALTMISPSMDPHGNIAMALKVLQIIQALGLFVLPYLTYRWVADVRPYALGLAFNRRWSLVIFGLIAVAALPMINQLAEWNSTLTLPDSLDSVQRWIQAREADVEALLEIFLAMETPWHLLVNLFLVALVPAISEELFFRGTLQPMMLRMVRNHHAAIWLTAFIFSFFHMQFLGFFPRMLLGAMFGYAAHWSGSLLLPMFGHLINNGLAVIVTYLIGIGTISEEMETLGAHGSDWYLAALSTLAVATGLYAMHKRLARVEERP